MKTDLTPILQLLFALLSAVVTGLLIPLLKAKLSAEKSEKLAFWIKKAVAAAEQLFGSGTGEQKKDYVLSFLLDQGLVNSTGEVTALLESEVYRLQNKA